MKLAFIILFSASWIYIIHLIKTAPIQEEQANQMYFYQSFLMMKSAIEKAVDNERLKIIELSIDQRFRKLEAHHYANELSNLVQVRKAELIATRYEEEV